MPLVALTFDPNLPSRLQHVRDGKLDLHAASLTKGITPRSPLSFDVSLFNRPYIFRIHYPCTTELFDSRSPSLDLDAPELTPAFAIIAFAIPERRSLDAARLHWRKQLSYRYDTGEMPVMLLGLRRDERTADRDEDGEFVCVMPEEGMRAAQEMRCDRYAECSAFTGELMFEVLEDITRTAALTTTEKGALSSGSGCSVM
jgi:Ras homolog gene family, member A